MKPFSNYLFKGTTAFRLMPAVLLVLLTSFLSSCLKEPDPVPTGEAKVRYVNAVPGSNPQNFYVNGQQLNSLTVSYGFASDYVTITSGYNNFIFADQGSTTGNATDAGTLAIGDVVTFFYYRTQDNKVLATGINDDLSAPAAGKAKVRFINIDSFLPPTTSSIAITTVGGSALETALAFRGVSKYYEVNPGAQFSATATTATGVITAPNVNPGIVAGKTYTIWYSGTTATELTGYTIVHN